MFLAFHIYIEYLIILSTFPVVTLLTTKVDVKDLVNSIEMLNYEIRLLTSRSVYSANVVK